MKERGRNQGRPLVLGMKEICSRNKDMITANQHQNFRMGRYISESCREEVRLASNKQNFTK